MIAGQERDSEKWPSLIFPLAPRLGVCRRFEAVRPSQSGELWITVELGGPFGSLMDRRIITRQTGV